MTRLPYRFRMYDPYVMRLNRIRPRFMRIGQLVARNALRARFEGYRRGPNKHGRHFARISAEMLEARRCGVCPRVLAGRGE